MKIDISDLVNGQRSFLEIDATEEEDYIGNENLRQLSPIRVQGTAVLTGKGLLLDLTCRATVEQECSRCTKIYSEELEISFSEEMPLTEEQKNKHELLDVTELIRDNIIVRLPNKSLCSKDCKGLCPVCGIDRNVGECTCETEQIDPRLSVLNNLLNEDE